MPLAFYYFFIISFAPHIFFLFFIFLNKNQKNIKQNSVILLLICKARCCNPRVHIIDNDIEPLNSQQRNLEAGISSQQRQQSQELEDAAVINENNESTIKLNQQILWFLIAFLLNWGWPILSRYSFVYFARFFFFKIN